MSGLFEEQESQSKSDFLNLTNFPNKSKMTKEKKSKFILLEFLGEPCNCGEMIQKKSDCPIKFSGSLLSYAQNLYIFPVAEELFSRGVPSPCMD